MTKKEFLYTLGGLITGLMILGLPLFMTGGFKNPTQYKIEQKLNEFGSHHTSSLTIGLNQESNQESQSATIDERHFVIVTNNAVEYFQFKELMESRQ